ncbi:High-affinity nitrate transporter 2.1 [Chytridiales sp. JEL 0842]|nr:High-affinity nitrate transporter 2.1 [Chytridiales sp. JEL 0842]
MPSDYHYAPGQGAKQRQQPTNMAPLSAHETTNDSNPRLFTTKPLTYDTQGKSLSINLLSLGRPHMRSFHLAWLAFFVAFTGWFAYSPILKKTVAPDLGMTEADIANSDIANVAATVVFRVFVGPAVDRFGASRVMALILFLGSVPLALSTLSKTPIGLVLSRLFIGLLGASFVPCQYWTTSLFSPSIVGSANALAGGWGNMGAGVTYLLMPRLYSLFHDTAKLPTSVSWRVAMSFPVLLLWVVAFSCFWWGEDKPGPEFVKKTVEHEDEEAVKLHRERSEVSLPSSEEEGTVVVVEDADNFLISAQDSKTQTKTKDVSTAELGLTTSTPLAKPTPTGNPLKNLIHCISTPPIIILMFAYACSFGVELSVDGALGNYYIQNFQMDQATASLFGALFGLLNIFSRFTGGLVSDLAAKRFGLVGRIYWHASLFLIASTSLVIFSRLQTVGSSISALIIFSYAVQAACGSTFGIVPFLGPYMGSASGLIGAGGNIGGALFNVMLRFFVGRMREAFMWMGVAIALGGFLCSWALVVQGEYMAKPLVKWIARRTGRGGTV